MVLLISELAKIGATKPIFLDSGSPREEGGRGGGGGHGCVGKGCYKCICIIHILKSSKNYIYFCL